MKTLLWAALLFPLFSFAQGDGIRFFEGNWQAALALAKTEDKIIFVDAYTTWCGPCKKMSAEVFPVPEVGAIYNKNFINVKLDMEKGDGPNLASFYAVQAYPTYLFVNSDGSLEHRGLGYLPKDKFIDLALIALDTAKNFAASEKNYNDRRNDPEFLYEYSYQRLRTGDGAHVVAAQAYLNTQKDWSSPKNAKFIYEMNNSAAGSMFRYMIDHRADFDALMGAVPMQSYVDKLMAQLLNETTRLNEKSELDTLLTLVYPTRAKRLIAYHNLTWARQRGDRNAYANAAQKYFSVYNDNPEELAEAAWTVYDSIENPETVAQGVKWAKRAVKLNDAYYSREILGWMYFKQGNTKKAAKQANKAIAKAAQLEEDTSGARELLKRLGQ